MKTLLKNTAIIAATILMIDFIGFAAWVMSGQFPVDGFYIGTITAEILKLII